MPEVQKNPSLNLSSARGETSSIRNSHIRNTITTPSHFRACPAPAGGGLGRGFPRIPNICMRSYRYGFNGMEKDDEVKGSGNSYTTEFRLLDVRIGRWWSIDPKANSYESPYTSIGNSPLLFIDPMGDLIDHYFDNETGEYLGDTNEGSEIRVISKNEFNQITTYLDDPTNLSSVHNELKEGKTSKKASSLDPFFKAEDQRLLIKILEHYNPTDLKLTISNSFTSTYTMAFVSNAKYIVGLVVNELDLPRQKWIFNNYHNVISIYNHENGHYSQYKLLGGQKYHAQTTEEKEQYAIATQLRFESFWTFTTEGFRESTFDYAIKHGLNPYIFMPIQKFEPILATQINPIIETPEKIPYP